MPPYIPPKPQQQQQQMHLQLQLNNLSLRNTIKPADLPFPIITSDHAIQLFIKKKESSLDVPLPSYFEFISNSKIKEFLNNEILLFGYINSLYKDEFSEIKNDVDSIIKSQQEVAINLKQKYTNKSNGLLSKVAESDKELELYHCKLKNFDHLQIEMYDSLSDLSTESITNFFNKKVSENEKECGDILKNASEREGILTTQELEKALNDYITKRHEWHEFKECVSKLNHHKIIGLK